MTSLSIEPIKNLSKTTIELLVVQSGTFRALNDKKLILELIKFAQINDIPLQQKSWAEPKVFSITHINDLNIHVRPQELHGKEKASCFFVLWLFNECYALKGKWETDSIFRIEEAYYLQNRSLDRFELKQQNTLPVKIKEMTGRRSFSGIIKDISAQGVGIDIPLLDQDSLNRILQCEKQILLEPIIPGIQKETVRAAVKHWFKNRNGKDLRLGLSCHIPLASGDQDSLEDFLLDQKYPQVSRAKYDSDFNAVWDLMINELSSAIHVNEEKRETSVVTWKKASWNDRPINRIYILKSREGPKRTIGTLSVSRFYSRSWLIHQLAVDGSQARVLSHQMYGRVLDFLRQSSEVSYTIGTWPKEARVFKRYYLDFINQDDPRNHFLEEAWILEFNIKKGLEEIAPALNPAIKVSEFSYTQQELLLKNLEEVFPRIFLEAHDLRPFDMLLENVSSLYERVGLKRKRRIVCAYANGKYLGGAFIDWGSRDQNIFSLFDNFRTFVSRQCPDNLRESVKLALVHEALKTYARENVLAAISWTKDHFIKKAIPSSHIELDAYFWIADASGMKYFLRHLDRLHGRMSSLRMLKNNHKHRLKQTRD